MFLLLFHFPFSLLSFPLSLSPLSSLHTLPLRLIPLSPSVLPYSFSSFPFSFNFPYLSPSFSLFFPSFPPFPSHIPYFSLPFLIPFQSLLNFSFFSLRSLPLPFHSSILSFFVHLLRLEGGCWGAGGAGTWGYV